MDLSKCGGLTDARQASTGSNSGTQLKLRDYKDLQGNAKPLKLEAWRTYQLIKTSGIMGDPYISTANPFWLLAILSQALTLSGSLVRFELFEGKSTSTPQLPFKRPQIPSNRDQQALNRGPLGVQVQTPSILDPNRNPSKKRLKCLLVFFGPEQGPPGPPK